MQESQKTTAPRHEQLARELMGTALFCGIAREETAAMLGCLDVRERTFEPREIIFRMGDKIRALGIVLDGGVRMEHVDAWGNVSVLGYVGPGDAFGENYACAPDVALLVNVMTVERTRVALLDVTRVLTLCSSVCPYHTKLVENLLALSARKNIELSRRAFHTSPKTIRAKLLSYLSGEATRAGSRRFTIPYNREQLAGYLSVNRSALSNELSQMERDGLIHVRRNEFELCAPGGQR